MKAKEYIDKSILDIYEVIRKNIRFSKEDRSEVITRSAILNEQDIDLLERKIANLRNDLNKIFAVKESD